MSGVIGISSSELRGGEDIEDGPGWDLQGTDAGFPLNDDDDGCA